MRRVRVVAPVVVGLALLSGCTSSPPSPPVTAATATGPGWWSAAPPSLGGPTTPGPSTSPSSGPTTTVPATSGPGASPAPSSPGQSATPTPGPPGSTPTPSPTPEPVVVDVLRAFRDSGSTSYEGGGSASATTRRSVGGFRGFFGDARASVREGRAGEASAYARGATVRSFTVPTTGTYAYEWRARYHVDGVSPGGPDDDASVRATSTVDPGVFSERGPVVAADLTIGDGIEVPIDETLTGAGRVSLTAEQRVAISLEASCDVTSSGLAEDSTCRSWIGLDRFVLRLVG